MHGLREEYGRTACVLGEDEEKASFRGTSVVLRDRLIHRRGTGICSFLLVSGHVETVITIGYLMCSCGPRWMVTDAIKHKSFINIEFRSP